jgi:hypothetical protein
MTKTLDHASELEIHTCPTCFIVYAIPMAMSERKHEDGTNWYCPNGHHVVFSTSVKGKLDEMRRERDRLKQEQAWYDDRHREQQRELETAKRSAAALKGQVTKITRRVGHGVCPCCNRTFAQLARHMAAKHKNWTPVLVKDA